MLIIQIYFYCLGAYLEQLLDTVKKELKSLKSWFDYNRCMLYLCKINNNFGKSINFWQKTHDKQSWNYILK